MLNFKLEEGKEFISADLLGGARWDVRAQGA
jgi:hypothetical protein